jgi:hypothetical protein
MYLSTYQAEADMHVRVNEELSNIEQRRMVAEAQEPNWIKLHSLGEQFDELVERIRSWFVAPPQPRQECC